ncbi:zinc-binding dehydrogenase [Rhizobium sp. 1399]|uniref:zinc-binding dehydrogenase n=1 Tax=Rhizobium sp. 1399 TaxID=2817758 RepID=UPI00285BDF9A|nr:zinc-binding dehydrogenase [Rhizobium sp. 1399]MDR6665298.1 NADPH:quinone reductase-like Zn-dependent oxidoreductase [Rhizobium sp. 1399]
MAYRDMVAFVDENRIKLPIAEVYAFDQVLAAYQRAAGSDQFGKIVIRIGH